MVLGLCCVLQVEVLVCDWWSEGGCRRSATRSDQAATSERCCGMQPQWIVFYLLNAIVHVT